MPPIPILEGQPPLLFPSSVAPVALLFVHRGFNWQTRQHVAGVVDMFVKRNPHRMALKFSQLMVN